MNIIINNLCKSYGETVVLDHLDTVIAENRITCLMGPSGVGKTTLMNILMGFEEADSGVIENIPTKKSAVFQENRLCESFSALTNVKIVNDQLTDNIICRHLEMVGLGESINQKVCTLSGGMKRRVALVRAVLAEKDILFLDEPFKGLDEDTRKTVIEYLLANTADTTVVMVTHDIEEVQMLGADVLYMKDGRISR